MSLETGTYISDLNAANPTSSDPKSQGDDHIRLIKSVLQSTFPAGSAAHYPLVAGTATNASGTSVDFTSIPSWVKRITISLAGLSTSGTSNPLIQIGDSGGIEATGYAGAGSAAGNGVVNVTQNYTTGFGIAGSLAANVVHGAVVLTLVNPSANTWVAHGAFALSNDAATFSTAGAKSLSATLDRVRITTVNGTDTFDAGVVNIQYE